MYGWVCLGMSVCGFMLVEPKTSRRQPRRQKVKRVCVCVCRCVCGCACKHVHVWKEIQWACSGHARSMGRLYVSSCVCTCVEENREVWLPHMEHSRAMCDVAFYLGKSVLNLPFSVQAGILDFNHFSDHRQHHCMKQN